MSLPEQRLSHEWSNDTSGQERPPRGSAAENDPADVTAPTPERELAELVMAREQARHAPPANSLLVGEEVLRLLRERLRLWFGDDGVTALISRATVRASEGCPVLTKVRPVPHEGRQLDLLHDRPRLDQGDWIREAVVELLTMLFTLLGRLLGLDLVTRLVWQVWPDGPTDSVAHFNRTAPRE